MNIMSIMNKNHQARRVYLDNSATTRVDRRVIESMLPWLGEDYGNASSTHYWGQRARQAVEDARREVARAINGSPAEITFVSGGTEADNLAIKGAALAGERRGRHLIISSFEHSAVASTCEHLESHGWRVTRLPVYEQGVVRPEDVREAITNETVLISVMHANNELGTIQPLAEIGRLVKERREAGQSHLLFHTDAVQTIGKIPVDVQELGVDLLALSGHKFHGPKGVGALWVRRGVRIEAQIHGGHQERDRRSGTENVAGIVGLGRAIGLAVENLPAKMAAIAELRDELEAGLFARIPHISRNGAPEHRIPGISNLNFDFVEGEGLQISLDLRGVGVSTGSACSSGSTEPSRALAAIGLNGETGRGSIRFSFCAENSREDVAYVMEVLPTIVEKLRQLSPRARRMQVSAD